MHRAYSSSGISQWRKNFRRQRTACVQDDLTALRLSPHFSDHFLHYLIRTRNEHNIGIETNYVGQAGKLDSRSDISGHLCRCTGAPMNQADNLVLGARERYCESSAEAADPDHGYARHTETICENVVYFKSGRLDASTFRYL